jgi:hypothetical protein
MSLVALANHIASKGRGDDKMLVHMTPGEVQGLQALALAHGGSLTVNPETGLVEAGWLKKLLPAIAGFALNFIAPGVGTAIGAALGGLSGAVGSAIAVGGITGLATGSLKQGIMAGLGAYGGASLASGIAGAAGAQGVAGALGVEGAATGAGSQAAMLAEQTAGFGSEGLQKLAESAAVAKGASPSLIPAMSAGIQNLGTAAGRSAFMEGIGGPTALRNAALMAAAPVIADQLVPTTTQMPSGVTGFSYTPRIRPMAYNQYTGELQQLPMFSAINRGQGQTASAPAPAPAPQDDQQPGGMASGGIVALANGGMPNIKEFMDKTGADFLTASDMLYGVIGSNQDTRNWNSIMAASDPLAAARQATNAMYGGVQQKTVNDTPMLVRGSTPEGINPLLTSGVSRAQNFGIGLTGGEQYLLSPEQIAALNRPATPAPAPQTSTTIDVPEVTEGSTVTGSTGQDRTYGGTTTTPTYTAPEPKVTQGAAFQPTPQTMSQVRSAYEQGGGATRMPTITDITPGQRTYTQNAVADMLTRYLQGNPNATFNEVLDFAKAKGIPEMQARAAYNEFRFASMTGATKSAYDYLMGRGDYPVNQVLSGNAPLMKPYLEASGISTAGDFYGRKTIPTDPTRRTSQGTDTTTGGTGNDTVTGGTGGTGGSTVTNSAITGGGTSTTGGGVTTLVGGTTTGGTTLNTETGDTYTPLSGTPITDALFGTQDTSNVEVVDRSTYTDSAMNELLANEAALNASRAEVEDVLNVENIERDILNDQMDAALVDEIMRAREMESVAAEDQDIRDALLEQAELDNQRRMELDQMLEGASQGYDWNAWDGEAAGYDGGGGRYTADEMALMAGMRKGGLAAIAAAAAHGGRIQRYNLGGYSDGGRLLRGPGDGVSDSIPATIGNRQPARLADGEFVIPARIVSELGNGSTEAGARKLYAMMDRVQRARSKTVGKGRNKVAKNTRADQHLPA